MNGTHEHDRRKVSSPIIWLIVLALMLYVGSIGPFWGLSARRHVSSKTTRMVWGTFYFPISWTAHANVHCRESVEFYVNFWLPGGMSLNLAGIDIDW